MSTILMDIMWDCMIEMISFKSQIKNVGHNIHGCYVGLYDLMLLYDLQGVLKLHGEH